MLCRSSIAFSSCKSSNLSLLASSSSWMSSKLFRLLFMTYNGFVMLAVAVGAFVGYLAFGDNTSASKTVACH